MIELTKLNGSRLVINSDLIEFVEALPDSLITLTTGKKIMVQEKIPEIIAAVVSFRRMINQRPEQSMDRTPDPEALKDA
ncbi:MAG TPA: flagellar FlbD family protein [bacterium]|jgi:flagellar protein FlbD